MFKKIRSGIAGASLLAACTLSYASAPLMLTESQLDTVSAGTTVTGPEGPDLSQFSSVGAVAWAMSSASVTPGLVVVIDANFDAKVGLSSNWATFTYNVRYF